MTAYGYWYYHDRAGVKTSDPYYLVELVDEGGNSLGYDYVDSDGYWEIVVDPAPSGQVRSRFYAYNNYDWNELKTIVPEGDSDGRSSVYYTYSDLYSATDGLLNMDSWWVKPEDERNKAYWIVRDLSVAYLTPPWGATLPGACTVKWGPDSIDGTFYRPGEYVHLKADDPWSYHNVMHEYGHNVMWNVYGGWMPASSCPDPHYMFGEEEVGCAWKEGWATSFAIICSDDPVYKWPDDGGKVDLENQGYWDSWPDGADVEGRIAGALYDLYDWSDDGEDIYWLGINDIWDTMTNEQSSTYEEFYADWKRLYHDLDAFQDCSRQNTIDFFLPPVNDACDQAIAISQTPYTYTLSTLNATSWGDPVPSCSDFADAGQRGVWFRYTPSSDGVMTLDTIGSNFDTMLTVYTGSCSVLSEIACNDDDYLSSLYSRISDLHVRKSSTYYILASGWAANFGWLTLNLEFTSSTIHDVTLTSLTASPNPANKGQTVTFTYTVQNLGNMTETNLTFKLSYGSAVLGTTQTVGSLTAGQQVTKTMTVKVPKRQKSGDYLITGTVSTVSGETDTANNSQTVKVTVK